MADQRVSEEPAGPAPDLPQAWPRSGPTARRVIVVVVAFLLCGWVFLYRFNTLGGQFGGFDNDHFLYFALAKQVQAGEQPLRDFQDSMHGAWPSLTYELSAAAQRVFGDNLRSEAWLTVGGVALGAAVAFVAGSAIAAWPWALVTALLSALLAPKLYGYPKVLVTAVASLIIVGCSGLPTWRRVAVMSVWTAVAFLFRHDYAVYCAAGFIVAIGLGAGSRWREGLRRAGAYLAITTVLLAPSLVWVQRYSGLTEYVRNGLDMSRREYERTRRGWPVIDLEGVGSPLAVFDNEDNAEAWLYYVFLSLPMLVVGAAAWQFARGVPERDERAAALVALSVMTVLLWYSFLRGNIGGRLGDMGPPVAVLAAYLLSAATARGRPWPRTVTVGSLASVILAVTVVATWQLASVASELRTARLYRLGDAFERTRAASQDLAAMPRSLRESQAGDVMQAADYLHRCTRPTDRVIAMGYYPDVVAFSERLFAGGRVTYVYGFYDRESYARETIAKLESQSVPIIVGGDALDDERLRLTEYLRPRYEEVGIVTINQATIRVMVRRGVTGTPTGPNGLPCFG
jgi:hypothetical protein